jgi:hypothetical protein
VKLKISAYLFFIAIALLVSAIAVSELLDVFSVPNQYVFGTEVGGWVYESRENFILFNSLQALIGIVFLVVISILLIRLRPDKSIAK